MIAKVETEFLHDGKRYVTVPANHCDKCSFYWRDGGIYDSCEHPDQTLVKRFCGVDNRAKGINVSWVEDVNWPAFINSAQGDELLPCPFCGCHPELVKVDRAHNTDNHRPVKCLTVDCPMHYIYPDIKAWNKRA